MSCEGRHGSHTSHQLCQQTAKSLMLVSKSVYCDLKQLCICQALQTHRGTTGGQRQCGWLRQCSITTRKIRPIVTNNRPACKATGTGACVKNLTPVQRSIWPSGWLRQCSITTRKIRPIVTNNRPACKATGTGACVKNLTPVQRSIWPTGLNFLLLNTRLVWGKAFTVSQHIIEPSADVASN